jgi:hypothetical protein
VEIRASRFTARLTVNILMAALSADARPAARLVRTPCPRRATSVIRVIDLTDVSGAAMGAMMTLCGDPDTPPLAPLREQAYHLAGVHAAAA